MSVLYVTILHRVCLTQTLYKMLSCLRQVDWSLEVWRTKRVSVSISVAAFKARMEVVERGLPGRCRYPPSSRLVPSRPEEDTTAVPANETAS